MKFKLVGLLVVLLAGVLVGCSASTTLTPEPESSATFEIQVQDVLVEPGVKVELMGSTTLPEGNCVYTQLVQENAAVDWWPVGKCFPVSSPEWTFSVQLGVEGAPDNLEPDADYCIRIWWPGAPSVTLAEYHFSLAEATSP